jgi:hypothetical protein
MSGGNEQSPFEKFLHDLGQAQVSTKDVETIQRTANILRGGGDCTLLHLFSVPTGDFDDPQALSTFLCSWLQSQPSEQLDTAARVSLMNAVSDTIVSLKIGLLACSFLPSKMARTVLIGGFFSWFSPFFFPPFLSQLPGRPVARSPGRMVAWSPGRPVAHLFLFCLTRSPLQVLFQTALNAPLKMKETLSAPLKPKPEPTSKSSAKGASKGRKRSRSARLPPQARAVVCALIARIAHQKYNGYCDWYKVHGVEKPVLDEPKTRESLNGCVVGVLTKMASEAQIEVTPPPHRSKPIKADYVESLMLATRQPGFNASWATFVPPQAPRPCKPFSEWIVTWPPESDDFKKLAREAFPHDTVQSLDSFCPAQKCMAIKSYQSLKVGVFAFLLPLLFFNPYLCTFVACRKL